MLSIDRNIGGLTSSGSNTNFINPFRQSQNVSHTGQTITSSTQQRNGSSTNYFRTIFNSLMTASRTANSSRAGSLLQQHVETPVVENLQTGNVVNTQTTGEDVSQPEQRSSIRASGTQTNNARTSRLNFALENPNISRINFSNMINNDFFPKINLQVSE